MEKFFSLYPRGSKAYYLFYILSNLFLIISVLQFNVAEFIGVKQLVCFFKKSKKNDKQSLNRSFCTDT